MNEKYDASAVANSGSHGYLGSELETNASRLLSVRQDWLNDILPYQNLLADK